MLATDADDAVLGAAIMLPDHPQLAPESRGDLFDATEIEEALLLHVLALSDGEREPSSRSQDPAVREMLERAVSATPEDIMRLHGRMTISDPGARRGPSRCPGEERDRRRRASPTAAASRSSCGRRPAATRRTTCSTAAAATIERIYSTTTTASTSCVTVDDDPGQELMRDIGRYLYFKPAEVEVLSR